MLARHTALERALERLFVCNNSLSEVAAEQLVGLLLFRDGAAAESGDVAADGDDTTVAAGACAADAPTCGFSTSSTT